MTGREPSKHLDEIAHDVIGAAIEVHRHLGPGYLESIYEEALSVELAARGIQHQRQLEIGVSYKGRNVGNGRLDLLVERQLVVELKTVEQLLPIHRAQVISYLKAMQLQLGLLINFNDTTLKQGVKRIIHTST